MTTTPADGMLIDLAMPTFDAVIAEHAIVAADPSTTFDTARTLDLLTVRTPLLAASMWIRALPARALGRAVPAPPQLVVATGGLPGWLMLGERPGREIVFGAVGKVWQPAIEWRDMSSSEFSHFTEPGWAKIAANFSVSRYGERLSLLTYECRTATTDAESQRHFVRYWHLIRPFVGHIMRATVNKIKTDAERSEQSVGISPLSHDKDLPRRLAGPNPELG